MPSARLSAGLLALAAFVVVPSHAADETLPTEADYFDELPVVLSGSRLSQRLDASPVAITVLDQAVIRASGAREIQELFRLVPGMIVGYHDGNNAFVTYHAFADRYARRMQVLIDGRSVYTPAFGGVDWSALPLAIEDIERIEIIRGPNAAAFGANAFLGTINIVTRAPRDVPGAELRVRHGERGVRDYVGRFARLGREWGARLSVSDWRDEGFVNPDGAHDDKRSRFFNGRIDGPFSDGHVLLEVGALTGDRTAGEDGRVFEPPHGREVSRNHQSLRWDLPLGAEDVFAMQLYHLREDVDERFETLPIPALGGATATLDYGVASDRADFELTHSLRLTPDARAVWGLGTRVDEVISTSFFGPTRAEQQTRFYRAFGHGEWQLSPTLLANAGLMVEYSELSGGEFSPRVAFNWQTAPGRAWRAGVGRAVRTPVLIEERADQRFQTGPVFDQVLLSSGDLEAESIVSWELGYLRAAGERGLSLDARLFYDQIDGLITYFMTPYPDPFNGTTQDFRNGDRATVRGGELNLDWRLDGGFRVVANYAYTSIHSQDNDERYSRSAPRHNASLLVLREFGRYEASAAWYRYTDLYGLDTLDHMPGMSRVDARLAVRLGGGPRAPRLAVVGQALDGEYRDMRRDNLFDTRVHLELAVEF